LKIFVPIKDSPTATKVDPVLGTQATFEGNNTLSSINLKPFQLAYSSDQRVAHNHSQAYILDLETLAEKRLTYQDGDVIRPFWYQDKIVYSSTTDEIKERPNILQKVTGQTEPSYEIYETSIETSNIERLTNRPGRDEALGVIRDQIYYKKLDVSGVSIKKLNHSDNLIPWDVKLVGIEYSNVSDAWLLAYKDKIQIKHSVYEISVDLPKDKLNLQEVRWSTDGKKISFVFQSDLKYFVFLYVINDECFKKLIESDKKIQNAIFVDTKDLLILSAEKNKGLQVFAKAIEMKQLYCTQL
jgi:Tol biopolymer transport system component